MSERDRAQQSEHHNREQDTPMKLRTITASAAALLIASSCLLATPAIADELAPVEIAAVVETPIVETPVEPEAVAAPPIVLEPVASPVVAAPPAPVTEQKTSKTTTPAPEVDTKATKTLEWTLPNGGTATNVTWPQPVFSAASIACGTSVTVQIDVYRYGTAAQRAIVDAFDDDGVLRQGEDSSAVISWSFRTYKAPACVATPIVAPTLAVTPPTCDVAGSLPFLGNPAAQNPNGYEFPGLGYRVYISPAFNGAGTYTATIQKIGAGFDAAFPYGTKLSGETTQTLIVASATGYQSGDADAPCYVALPTGTNDASEWAGEYDCDDTTVVETRVVTSTSFELDVATGEILTASSEATETRERDLTSEEIAQLDCPVIVQPVTPAPPVIVDQPTADTPVAAAAVTPETSAQRLAFTGGNDGWIGGGLFAAVLLVLGALLVAARRVRE